MKMSWIIFGSALAVASWGGALANSGMSPRDTTRYAVPSSEHPGEVIEIRLDVTVTYAELELRWIYVQDSRCATGTKCYWAGEVEVTLEVACAEPGVGKPERVQVTLRAGKTPSSATAFGHEMELIDVVPYPRDGVTPRRSDYRAEIRIAATLAGHVSDSL